MPGRNRLSPFALLALLLVGPAHAQQDESLSGLALSVDTRIESPPSDDGVQTLSPLYPGDTIQFQLFVSGGAGKLIHGFAIELDLPDKEFTDWVDSVHGMDWTGNSFTSRDPAIERLSYLYFFGATLPSTGYLGQIDIVLAKSLEPGTSLIVKSMSIIGGGDVHRLDVSSTRILIEGDGDQNPGDFDGNGRVDLLDLQAFELAFARSLSGSWFDSRMDLNGDGRLDLADFVAFLLLFGTAYPVSADNDVPVAIWDGNLRAAIESELEKPSGAPITRAEMASLQTLAVSTTNIASLRGLEYATGLQILYLHDQDIRDLTELSGLTGLHTLILGGNRSLTRIAPLMWLSGLRQLHLSRTGVADITALSSLTGLQSLSLSRTGVTNISALAGLAALEYLDLSSNDLSDIAPLAGLTGLRHLELSETGLTDITQLTGLSGLARLVIENNRLTDISPLAALASLTKVWLTGNPLSTQSISAHIPALQARGTIVYFADAAVHRLTHHGTVDWDPSWSADGTGLAFESYREGNAEIYAMDADGGNLRNLTNNGFYDGGPLWSPDGSRIAFTSDRDGNREIHVMASDGKNPVNLTNHSSYDGSPSWSPDGTRIAFTSDRDDNREIYVMNSDGGSPQNLTNHSAHDSNPAWSPDGSRIAFHSFRDGNFEVYVMDLIGGELRKLTDHEFQDGSPSWSPDGSRIAFESNRDGNYEIYVMDSDGGNPQNLTQHSSSASNPSWSPDGSRIAFNSDRDGNREIYAIDVL